MPSSLGSLVVSLGLDAAEFVDGLTKSEYQARAFVRNVTATTTRMVGAFAAVGVGIGATLAVLHRASSAIAVYQDLADQVGDTAEAMAGLQLAADLSGKGLDQVAAASVKLTAALSKSDDESKGVGAALAAINIPVKEFKQLDPVAQLERVAGALADFEDGAGKTAVAVALFGRSGAELIPFLNDLAETGGRNVRLTKEQIETADRFAKKLDLMKSEASSAAKMFVADMIPAADRVLKYILGLDGGIDGLRKTMNDLAHDSSVKEWADLVADVAIRFLQVAKVVDSTLKTLDKLAIFGGTIARNASPLRAFSAQARKENADALAALQDAAAANGANIQALFAPIPRDESPGAAGAGNGRRRLAFDPTGNDPAVRKAALDAELAAVKRFLTGLTSAYGSSESILEANRAAGLAGEAEYYDAKRAFIQLNADAEVRALQAENARLADEKASGADRIKILQQIADNEAEIDRVRTKSAAAKEVLDIQQTAANTAIVRSFQEARQAAQEYLDTLTKQQQRELEGMGMGQRFRDRQAGGQQIDDRYQAQRDELANNRALLELEGKWTSESQAQYDERLRIINEFHAKARESYDAFWVYRERREADGLLGAQEAARNYIREAENAYQQSSEAMGSMLNTFEDNFAGAMDGNFKSFRGFADAMEREWISTINRMVAKALTAKLAEALGLGQVGSAGTGSGFGGFLAGLFGGGGIGYGSAGTAAASAVVPGPGGTFVPALAGGGQVEAGGFYRVNERRTEMLSVNGRDYLMAGAAGRVRPNPQFAASGQPVTVQMTVIAQDVESFRRSEGQVTTRLGMALGRSRRFA